MYCYIHTTLQGAQINESVVYGSVALTATPFHAPSMSTLVILVGQSHAILTKTLETESKNPMKHHVNLPSFEMIG